MNPIHNKPPAVPSPSMYTVPAEATVTHTESVADTDIITTNELPPHTSGPSKTGSSSAVQDLDQPGGVPTSKEIQTAYDSINWDNPSLESIMKLMVMIYSKLKAANNSAKWTEANLQMNSLMKEAENMKSAALGTMWAKIGGAVASIGTSALSLGSNISQMKQINAIKVKGGMEAGDSFTSKGADLDDTAFRRMQQDIGQIQIKGAINSAGIDLLKGVAQGGEAIAQNAADQYNVDAKKDAAQAAQRGAYRDAAQQAEQTVDENIRKTQEMLQSLLQLAAETERSVTQRI